MKGAGTALSAEEEAWISAELGRDPSLSRSMLTRLLLGRNALRRQREAAEAAENARIDEVIRQAEANGLETNREAARQAIHEDDDRRRATAAAQRLAAARVALDSGETGAEAVRRWIEALRAPDGTPPSLEQVAERLGWTPRWVSELCRPFGGYRKMANRKS